MKTTKLYKVTTYVLDLNGSILNKDCLKEQIECNWLPEFQHIAEILETDCGEWSDDHELNHTNAPFDKYFQNKKG